MRTDTIPMILPTEGSSPATGRKAGEHFPVVFRIPEGIFVRGQSVGGWKIRADLSSRREWNPSSAFCDVSVAAGEIELFSVVDRRKAVRKVDARELASALKDWAERPHTDTPAATPPASAIADKGSFEHRCAMARLCSEDAESAKKAKRGRL